MSVETFDRQDREYVAWRDAHIEDGFIINSLRPPTSSYIRLHRASCRVLQGAPANGVNWTNHYIKTVSTRREDLEAWVAATFPGGAIWECGMCVVR